MGKRSTGQTNLEIDHWGDIKGKEFLNPLLEGSRQYRRAMKAIERRNEKKRKRGGGV